MDNDNTGELRIQIIDYLDEYAMECLNDVERDPKIQADTILALLAAQRQRWEVAARKETAVYIASMTHCPLGTTCSAHKTHDLAEFLATLDGERGKEQTDV